MSNGSGIDVLLRFIVDSKKAAEEVKVFGSTINQNITIVNNYNTAAGTAKKKTDEFTESTQKSSKAGIDFNGIFTSTASVLSSLTMALSSIISQHGVIGFIRDASSATVDFGKSVGIAAVATSGFTAYLANDFVSAFRSANSEMANVNSILLESPANFEHLKDKVADLSTSFKLATQTQIAEGLRDVAGAGFTGADGLTVMNTAVKASVAGLTSVQVAATPLVQVLNATGQSAKSSEAIMNSMFTTVQRGVLTFNDYGAGIGRVIGTASSLSVSLSTLNGGIALLTKMGSMPEAAFTNMNSLLLAFAAQSETAKKKAAELGIAIDGNAIKAKGLEAVVAEMVAAAEKTGDLNGTLMTLLGRQEALDAAIKLSTDSGKMFRKEVEANIESNKALDNSLAEITKKYEAQEKAISVGMDNIKISTGQVITSWIGKLFPALQSAIDYFNNLDAGSKTFIISIALIPPIIASLVASLGIVTLGIIAFAAQIALSSVALKIISANLGIVTGFFGRFAGGALVATRSMWGFTTSISAGSFSLAGLKTALIGVGTTLKATAVTMAAFFAPFAGFIVAMGALAGAAVWVSKSMLDMRTAFNEEMKMETDRAVNANKNASSLKDLRDKERQGLKLTAAEQKAYALALLEVSAGSKKVREEAQKRMDLSKKLAIEEEKAAKAPKGFTDEELAKRKEFFDKLSEEEVKATKNKLKIAQFEADKYRSEENLKLEQNLKLGLITEEEAVRARIQIEKTAIEIVSKARDEQAKADEQKAKAAEAKAEAAKNKKIKNAKDLLDTEIDSNKTKQKIYEVEAEILGTKEQEKYTVINSFLEKERQSYLKASKDAIFTRKERTEYELKAAEKELEIQKNVDKIFEASMAKRAKEQEKYFKRLAAFGPNQAVGIGLEYNDDLRATGKNKQSIDDSFNAGEITLAQKTARLNEQLETESLIYATIAKNFKGSEEDKRAYAEKSEEAIRQIRLNTQALEENIREENEAAWELFKQNAELEKTTTEDLFKTKLSLYHELGAAVTNFASKFQESNNEIIKGLSNLVSELGVVGSSAVRTYGQLNLNSNEYGNTIDSINTKLANGEISQGLADNLKKSAKETKGLNDAMSVIPMIMDEFGKSFSTAFANFDKFNKLAKDVNATQADFNELISDGLRSLPFIGEALADVTRAFTDWIGLTRSEAMKAQEKLVYEMLDKMQEITLDTEKETLDKLKTENRKTSDDILDKEKQLIQKAYDFEKEIIKKKFDLKKDAQEELIKLTEKDIEKLKSEIEDIDKEIAKRSENQNKNKGTSEAFRKDRSNVVAGLDPDFYRTPEDKFEIENDLAIEDLDRQLREGSISLDIFNQEMMDLAIKRNVFYQHIADTIKKQGGEGTKEHLQYQKQAGDAFSDYADFQQQKTVEQMELERGQKDAQIHGLEELKNKQLEDLFLIEIEHENLINKLNEKYKDPAGAFKISMSEALLSVGQEFSGLADEMKQKLALNMMDFNRNISEVQSQISDLNNQKNTLDSEIEKSKAKIGSIESGTNTNTGSIADRVGAGAGTASSDSPIPTSGAVTFAPVWNPLDQISNAVGAIGKMFGFSDGGIVSGPKSGFPAMLHGTEMILNQTQMGNLFKMINSPRMTPAFAGGGSGGIVINFNGPISANNRTDLNYVTDAVSKGLAQRSRNSYTFD
jgi:TP901 family phage tail tape measure protein